MKIFFYFIISLFCHSLICSQGVGFPNEPVQAPISGLWLLIVGGTALAFKKLKK